MLPNSDLDASSDGTNRGFACLPILPQIPKRLRRAPDGSSCRGGHDEHLAKRPKGSTATAPHALGGSAAGTVATCRARAQGALDNEPAAQLRPRFRRLAAGAARTVHSRCQASRGIAKSP